MDKQLHGLVHKFLNRNFPITKIKKGNAKRFQRGIVISNGFTGKGEMKYYIKEKHDFKNLYAELFRILVDVFGLSSVEINPILFQHLNLF